MPQIQIKEFSAKILPFKYEQESRCVYHCMHSFSLGSHMTLVPNPDLRSFKHKVYIFNTTHKRQRYILYRVFWQHQSPDNTKDSKSPKTKTWILKRDSIQIIYQIDIVHRFIRSQLKVQSCWSWVSSCVSWAWLALILTMFCVRVSLFRKGYS